MRISSERDRVKQPLGPKRTPLTQILQKPLRINSKKVLATEQDISQSKIK